MSAPSKNPDTPAEDIDLLVLTERSLLFFRRNRWVFLIALIVGMGLGFLNWVRLPTVYKSRLILHSFTLSNLDYIQVISNWNSLLKSGEHDLLATAMNMPRSSVGKVKQMKGVEIQKVFTPNNPHGFYIDVFVTDNAVLDELQAGIISGLENVEFIKKEISLKKENLNKLIADVSNELEKLDSTRAKIESMLNSRGQAGSMIVDISGLNKQRIELNEKLLYFKKDLSMTGAVQVLQGFSKFSKPAGPNLYVWLAVGFIGGLSLAFIFSVFRSVQQKLKLRRQ